MDILEIFSISILRTPIQKFILAGESKRAWAVWLAAAVDDRSRVAGIVPILYDGLNIQAVNFYLFFVLKLNSN